MHKYDFCGEQKYLHTRDIGKLKNMYALFFLWGGGAPGGAPIICGGARAPQAPRSYAPARVSGRWW